LGAIISFLMVDSVNLVLQHGNNEVKSLFEGWGEND